MSRLDEALERLERVVARLERGLAAGAPADSRLLAEREAEGRRRRELAGDLAARVDGALEAIARALGRGEAGDG